MSLRTFMSWKKAGQVSVSCRLRGERCSSTRRQTNAILMPPDNSNPLSLRQKRPLLGRAPSASFRCDSSALVSTQHPVHHPCGHDLAVVQ